MNIPKLRFKDNNDNDYPNWVNSTIGKSGYFYYGKSAPKWSITDTATTPCVRYGELYTTHNIIVKKIYSYTNIPKENLKFSTGNEVLVPRVGEEPLDFCKCCYLPFKDVAIGEMISVYNTKNNPLFISYMFNGTMKYKFARLVEGGNVSNLYYSYLENISINLPCLEEQKKIANFLSTVDKKITNLENTITSLENQKKGLLQQIFSQKLRFKDKNGNNYPNWEKKKLEDISNITMGQSPAGESYNDAGDGLFFYQGRTDFGLRFPTPRMYTTAPTRFAQKGDILLSVRAPVGDLNFAMEDCCIGRGLAAQNSKLGSQMHLFYTLAGFQQIFKVMDGNGTTFGSITKDRLFDMSVVIPPDEILMCFEKRVKPIESKIEKCEEEIRELTKLRDWLLPMLMSGQARVE